MITFKFGMRSFLTIFVLLSSNLASASEQPWTFNLEGGGVWQSRNDVRIPNDEGTRFSIDALTETGPFPYYRLEAFYNLGDTRQLRFLVAPLRFTESGRLDEDLVFVDETFNAGQAADFTYQFNSYRLSYRVLFKDTDDWRLWLGGTLKVRDAEIALQQGQVKASDSNVGVVPLFNLYSDYQLNPEWRLTVDFDGLVGPQGRAVDLGVNLLRDLDTHWSVGLGYRTLEGGADNDEVYNFAWLNYAFISLSYRP